MQWVGDSYKPFQCDRLVYIRRFKFESKSFEFKKTDQVARNDYHKKRDTGSSTVLLFDLPKAITRKSGQIAEMCRF